MEVDEAVPEIISEYTIEGRKAINILADAYGMACYRSDAAGGQPVAIEVEDVMEVAQVSRLSPCVTRKASADREIGRIFGLGVMGF